MAEAQLSLFTTNIHKLLLLGYLRAPPPFFLIIYPLFIQSYYKEYWRNKNHINKVLCGEEYEETEQLIVEKPIRTSDVLWTS